MQIYRFEKGDLVPEWLHRVRDRATGEVAVCRFGVSGGVLVNGLHVYVWPSDDRAPEAYVFDIEGFWGNAESGHPAGDQMRSVFPTQAKAVEALGLPDTELESAIPAEDPRV